MEEEEERRGRGWARIQHIHAHTALQYQDTYSYPLSCLPSSVPPRPCSTVSMDVSDDVQGDTEHLTANNQPTAPPSDTLPTPTNAHYTPADDAQPASSSSSPSSSNGAEMSASTLSSVHHRLFGPNVHQADYERWLKQAIMFSNKPRTAFGLLQTFGGPCGILAPLQAYILKDLLFSSPPPAIQQDDDVPFRFSHAQLNQALVNALTEVIHKVTPANSSYILVIGESSTVFRQFEFSQVEQLRSFFANHLSSFHSPLGCIQLVYSIILSHRLDSFSAEMDDPSLPLLGEYTHCSQELVNLLLTGKAVTNVFDGKKVLSDNPAAADAMVLKGVEGEVDIGFLTILEALRYSVVGHFYKFPKFPIWVVGGSEHYSVLFGSDRRISEMSVEQRTRVGVKQVFEALDPNNNGFIPTAQLTQLLHALKMEYHQQELPNIQQQLDPDSLDIILFDNVHQFYLRREAMKSVEAVQQHAEWSCQACTFINQPAASTCEICATNKPAISAPTSTSSYQPDSSSLPSSFTLWHFNGLEASERTSCVLTKCFITIIEGGELGKSDKQGLREGERHLLVHDCIIYLMLSLVTQLLYFFLHCSCLLCSASDQISSWHRGSGGHGSTHLTPPAHIILSPRRITQTKDSIPLISICMSRGDVERLAHRIVAAVLADVDLDAGLPYASISSSFAVVGAG